MPESPLTRRKFFRQTSIAGLLVPGLAAAQPKAPYGERQSQRG
jgi:hypothetical protein